MNMFRRAARSMRAAPLESCAAVLVVVAVFMVGYTFLSVNALGPFASADASSATVSGGAQIVNDTSAAGGKAIKFAASQPTTPPPTQPANWLRGKALYNDMRLKNDGRPAAISDQPYAQWMGGWISDPTAFAKQHTDAAAAQGKVPQFVLYNIPLRDCGLYSAGGLSNFSEYNTWITKIANGIGQREAVVVLEPDALAGVDCLSEAQKTDRINGLRNAVTILTTNTKSYVYIDAGNASWIAAPEMANRLKSAGVDKARGFALNVSNFHISSKSVAYGTEISKNIGDKTFVVDTSRNGKGEYVNAQDPEAWCNPPGRGLGMRPTTSPAQPLVDAYLWLKTPGESDGQCKGAPAPGEWYEAYAQELIRNANYNYQ